MPDQKVEPFSIEEARERARHEAMEAAGFRSTMELEAAADPLGEEAAECDRVAASWRLYAEMWAALEQIVFVFDHFQQCPHNRLLKPHSTGECLAAMARDVVGPTPPAPQPSEPIDPFFPNGGHHTAHNAHICCVHDPAVACCDNHPAAQAGSIDADIALDILDDMVRNGRGAVVFADTENGDVGLWIGPRDEAIHRSAWAIRSTKRS